MGRVEAMSGRERVGSNDRMVPVNGRFPAMTFAETRLISSGRFMKSPLLGLQFLHRGLIGVVREGKETPLDAHPTGGWVLLRRLPGNVRSGSQPNRTVSHSRPR